MKLVSCDAIGAGEIKFEESAILGNRDAEEIDSPPNAALREYFSLPEVEKSSLRRTGWIQLANNTDEAIFGLPGTEIPFDSVVVVRRDDSTGEWEAIGSTPCWPIRVDAGRLPVQLFESERGFAPKGEDPDTTKRLALIAAVPGCAESGIVSVVKESRQSVVINASVETFDEASVSEPCIPEDLFQTLEVSLDTPLRSRRVLQGNFVPPRELRTVNAGRFPEVQLSGRNE